MDCVNLVGTLLGSKGNNARSVAVPADTARGLARDGVVVRAASRNRESMFFCKVVRAQGREQTRGAAKNNDEAQQKSQA